MAAQVFSEFDMGWGYHHLEIGEETKERYSKQGGQGTLNPARMTKSGYSAVLRTKGYHPLYRGKM